ncbi:hypothetical protein NDI76_14170 [Halogeometricum sp. S1BR25-6]|uniref:DUF7573 domain-containing protein n=1 Tax=Halogeometricum salsisoli TaxID=2950536 RepID=A0ABU2GGF2_9EURY|nr:hypothetical protein [Halogeometricum sp. S1BR25-6]MDS0299891.1 hypothetical protein [Halogeometricum sp. S1BR25-6]
MTRDRSLDDFVGGGEDEEREDAGSDGDENADDENDDVTAEEAESGAVADSERTSPTTEDVDPAVGTYRWHPDGVVCAACGETVPRLWFDDGEQVCADCKEW